MLSPHRPLQNRGELGGQLTPYEGGQLTRRQHRGGWLLSGMHGSGMLNRRAALMLAGED